MARSASQNSTLRKASNEGKNPFPAPTRPSQASLVTPRAPKSPCALLCADIFWNTSPTSCLRWGHAPFPQQQQFHLGVFPQYTHTLAKVFAVHLTFEPNISVCTVAADGNNHAPLWGGEPVKLNCPESRDTSLLPSLFLLHDALGVSPPTFILFSSCSNSIIAAISALLFALGAGAFLREPYDNRRGRINARTEFDVQIAIVIHAPEPNLLQRGLPPRWESLSNKPLLRCKLLSERRDFTCQRNAPSVGEIF